MDNEIKVVTTLTKEQFELFKTLGVVIDEDEMYYHLPQWFRSLGNGEFEIISYDKLPDFIKEDYADAIRCTSPDVQDKQSSPSAS